jgi:hypothetical protein
MKIFKKIQAWINKILGKAFEEVQQHGALAVEITENLKKAIDSPGADIITMIIPGKVDDAALHWLRAIVPQIAFKVAIGYRLVENSSSPEQALNAVADYLRSLDRQGNDWAAFLTRFAAEITAALADGKLTYGEYVIISQMAWLQFQQQQLKIAA